MNLMDINAIDNADFILQRRATAPYSENRYFSAMPLPTARHFEILQMIEEVLSE
jgi:hypothetical protein